MSVPLEQLRATSDPELHYVFAVRLGEHWADFVVISRHVTFEPDRVQIRMDRGKTVSTLEVDIEIPNAFELAQGNSSGAAAAGGALTSSQRLRMPAAHMRHG